MTAQNVPGDEWVELVPSNFEDDYSVVVEDAPIYLYPGDKPNRPVAGLPLRADAIQSGQVDRGVALWGRSQTDVDASVRVVPNIRIDGSNERAVTVSTSVQTDTYDRGDDFDTASDGYPVDLSPDETIQHLLLSIVEGEIDVELTTTDGDVVTIPVDGKASIDSYSVESVSISDPGSAPRIAGGWAGE
ncbi:hypothetical protein C2R22_10755 [Salinigranum rubrum]|uniref:Uncharacterized protein n=1 Tax=Salinigranum rubrum TaxID=755307 RepID=A0A2I8VLV9_9EURY|nr:hypothetical protein [Salinigranum rubrum]AUV82069.1 hypothetical protein C2R22_10755 [Salinigranum rubrum]